MFIGSILIFQSERNKVKIVIVIEDKRKLTKMKKRRQSYQMDSACLLYVLPERVCHLFVRFFTAFQSFGGGVLTNALHRCA